MAPDQKHIFGGNASVVRAHAKIWTMTTFWTDLELSHEICKLVLTDYGPTKIDWDSKSSFFFRNKTRSDVKSLLKNDRLKQSWAELYLG